MVPGLQALQQDFAVGAGLACGLPQQFLGDQHRRQAQRAQAQQTRHLGVGLDQFAKALNGFVGLALLGLDHTFQEPDLHIAGAVLLFLLEQFGGLIELARLQGLPNGVCRYGTCGS